MRIIAGTKRGMVLFSPKGDGSRPITDRVKESLFDVLLNYGLPSAEPVADLFCGVGSLGLEALSRGAAFVTFVERDPAIIVTLERNIEKAGFVKESRVIRADAFKVGAPIEKEIENRKLKIENSRYALIFVDPPYADTADVGENSSLAQILYLLQNQMAEQGLVAVRTRRNTALLDQYGQFNVIDRRRWGTMAIVILRKCA